MRRHASSRARPVVGICRGSVRLGECCDGRRAPPIFPLAGHDLACPKMSALQTTLLGAIAGATIFLGLPLGRVRRLPDRWRAFLSVLSAGILLFIFWDVVAASSETVEEALHTAKDGGSWGRF